MCCSERHKGHRVAEDLRPCFLTQRTHQVVKHSEWNTCSQLSCLPQSPRRKGSMQIVQTSSSVCISTSLISSIGISIPRRLFLDSPSSSRSAGILSLTPWQKYAVMSTRAMETAQIAPYVRATARTVWCIVRKLREAPFDFKNAQGKSILPKHVVLSTSNPLEFLSSDALNPCATLHSWSYHGTVLINLDCGQRESKDLASISFSPWKRHQHGVSRVPNRRSEPLLRVVMFLIPADDAGKGWFISCSCYLFLTSTWKCST